MSSLQAADNPDVRVQGYMSRGSGDDAAGSIRSRCHAEVAPLFSCGAVLCKTKVARDYSELDSATRSCAK